MALYKSKPLLTIGRMYADTVSVKFTDSLSEMLLYTQTHVCGEDEYIHYEWGPCSWHSLGRNTLVEGMRGEWLLQLDTDHMFAPDMFKRMLNIISKNPDIKVLSGIYQSKFPPHNPVMGVWNGQKVAPILDWDRKAETIVVGAVGAGCLLVHRDVYKQIIKSFGCNPFDIIEGLSEDYSFCWRCKELGIPVYVAPQIECHHIISVPLSVQDYPRMEGTVVAVEDGAMQKCVDVSGK